MAVELIALGLLAFAAAIVRGYAGFGFSAIMITAGSLYFDPTALVPLLYLLEIVASVRMIKSTWHELDGKMLGCVLAGCALALPVGLHFLVSLPADMTRLILCITVLVCAIMVWRGFELSAGMSRSLGFLAGVSIGFGSGLGSIGGLPAMVIFLGARYPAVKTRAIFVFTFFGLYLAGSGLNLGNGLLHSGVWSRALWLAGPMLFGVWVGEKLFRGAAGKSYRNVALGLMVVLSAIGILRVVWIYSGY